MYFNFALNLYMTLLAMTLQISVSNNLDPDQAQHSVWT